MGLFKRKPKAPTPKELARIERTTHIEATEAEKETGMVDGVAFDYQVIEDENLMAIFHPNSPYHLEWLEELIPLFSRLNFLSNCSSRDAELFKMTVDRAITRLKYSRKRRDEKMLLNNLKTYFFMRINDSVNGWKLNTLTERKRTIRIREEQEKTRRFL